MYTFADIFISLLIKFTCHLPFCQLFGLKDSKESVYGTLDAWVAMEPTFPLSSLRKALVVLEKHEQWHRIVQVQFLDSMDYLYLS
jgi:hypothetical protein